ncbi:phosphoenolpyruvate-utilizing enzyme [Nocardia sp. Root136]|uniref:PEP/pyruvate-binding domain-containing protein n=1 Tax=Nocardia sp. Root136 TaxID=1736458 RepID=UPI0006F9EB2A|nr:PEP/pyruvate-binding domain-containing protein [Nocardia sp. Root136]KQY29164.1 phosphoenolpyruvate-utilizing enzyme [Nocardia sp. Root136]
MTATRQTARDLIIVLGEPGLVSPQSLGGKGARLDEMIRTGLPVPPAFCLTTELFDRFRSEIGLDDRALAGAPEAIRARLLAAEIPAEIREAILDAYTALGAPRVAVRSSACREDSAAQSFAGQYDTVLDISGATAVLEAVKACWASLWSDRVAAYRGADAAGSIAVVIQQMVQAEAAGVLFTRDPISGRTDRFVVDAVWGLGEGLVSGRVSADSFTVDPAGGRVTDQSVRYKVTKTVSVAPGIVELVRVPEELRGVACLSHEQLAGLAALAVRVREQYGAEQDIEWAVQGGALYLLQTRPITVEPPKPLCRSPYREQQLDAVRQGTLWSRMDIGEIFTGVMTPLGLSFSEYYQHNVHSDCVRATGVRDTGDIAGQMGYLQGYVYLNVSYTSYLLSQSIGTKDEKRITARFASEDVDQAAYRNPFGNYGSVVRMAMSTAFWGRATVAELRDMRKRARRMADARIVEFNRARAIDLTALDRHTLHAEMQHRLRFFHDMHVGYMPYFINAFTLYGVLETMCGTWLGAAGERLQNRLKTDMSNLRTVASAREVWELAQLVRKRPRVLRIITSGSAGDVAQRLRADQAGRVFWKTHMEPFLRENGVRAQQEMELTHPRWIDDLSYVIKMIRRYAEDGFSFDDAIESASGSRTDEAAGAIRRLPPIKRRALKSVIALYEKCSSLREVARMSMITSVWLVREIVYEVGARLVAAGVLRSLDEVAYLNFSDVLRYLASGDDPHEIFPRTAIDEARRTFQNYARLPAPPMSFVGEWDPTRPGSPIPDGLRLEGLGTSPGTAVGRARVVQDLAWQADEFEAGEILVTRYTDSSWTPLFAIAGGIVTDIGSMLSHSAIVAREFGLPSVVNTHHATAVIRTGDLIMVDGDRGVVEIIEE